LKYEFPCLLVIEGEKIFGPREGIYMSGIVSLMAFSS